MEATEMIKQVGWVGNCHKCGKQIYNGFPDPEKIHEFKDGMAKCGYEIGHKTRMVGTWGDMREVPIKPICSTCSNEEHKKQDEKEMKKAIRKIIPTLKKVFVCPVCEDESRHGYDTKIFKSSNKQEMINHLNEKHAGSEIERMAGDN